MASWTFWLIIAAVVVIFATIVFLVPVKPILSIARQTIRSAIRSKVFAVLFIMVILGTFLLPSVVGDGSLAGDTKVKLNYSLSIIGFLLGTAALWLSTVNISGEVDGYQIHMVLTKPVSPFQLWLGKWLGTSFLTGIIMIASIVCVYFQITWGLDDKKEAILQEAYVFIEDLKRDVIEKKKTANIEFIYKSRRIKYVLDKYATKEQLEKFKKDYTGEYAEDIRFSERIDPIYKKAKELDILHKEVLVGRRFYKSKKVDFQQVVINKIKNDPAFKQMSEQQVQAHANKMLKDTKKTWGTVLFGMQNGKRWTFEDLPKLKKDEAIYIRFKPYVKSTSRRKQRVTSGGWIAHAVIDGKKAYKRLGTWTGPSGKYDTLKIPGQLIRDGKLTIEYVNLDPQREQQIFQPNDGPFILIGAVGFTENFLRSAALLFALIAFLSIIGCSMGSCFTSPVAIFMSIAYIMTGMLMANYFGEDQGRPETFYEYYLKGVYTVLDYLVITLDSFVKTNSLTQGESIGVMTMLKVFFWDFLIKGLPMMLLGTWAIKRREMGLVIRK